jgi:NADH dehydrogenase (ubiquinone) 1 alpha subcomplex subunit 9
MLNDCAHAHIQYTTQGCEAFKGQTFQLAGPSEYSYKEIVEFVSDVAFLNTRLLDVNTSTALAAGKVVENFISPALTQDMVLQMLENVVHKNDDSLLTFKDLDIEPCNVDKVAFDYLSRYREGGHFSIVKGYH